MSVAFARSSAAPVDRCWKISSSDARPPNNTAILFSSSSLVIKKRSSVGRCIVYPRAPIPLGIIEILCTGSTPGKDIATSACPISWYATISLSLGLSRRFFFSSPATIRSIACVKSPKVTSFPFRRVASKAASLTKFARSAPVKPGVKAAMSSISIFFAKRIFFICTFKIWTRPILSGRSTRTWRSKRPARNKAGSKISGLFVAANSTKPLLGSKPSISDNNWFSVCSFSSWPPPVGWIPRARPSASSSSMKIIAGAFWRACSKRSLTRAAPTPTNISTNSDPLIEKNGTPASPATALASNVFPVPGGPTKRIPFGILAPSWPYAWGSFKKLIISWSSSLASSTPATSSKLTFVSFSTYTFTLLFPISIMPPAILPIRRNK